MSNYIRPDAYHYPSRRSEVFARNLVASSQPLAVEAGIEILRNGGNAIDAALATAICLTVVEPTSNGIGSDAFAIVWDGNSLNGFNGSGRAPLSWSPDYFSHLSKIPEVGWDAVTVPGAVDTWVQLSKRFGCLPWKELFKPGIHYARYGYHVTPIIQRQWQDAAQCYDHLDEFQNTFMPNGRVPEVGELFFSHAHADTLEEISRTGGDSFYRGDLARAMVADAGAHNAALSLTDLENHLGNWVDPLSLNYRNASVHELPPNGQGLTALIALGILNHIDIASHPVDSADFLHIQIEAMKLAFVDANTHIADPESMRTTPLKLLNPMRLKLLAKQIQLDVAMDIKTPVMSDNGTVYLCAADAGGNMVSMIQSNYKGFGSGIVVPGTGISLQNRGTGFSLCPDHPNQVAGGKRPFHTIIPGFLTKNGKPLGPFGVMGGHMQPQGHVQLVVRIFDYNQSLQDAMDAPRWYVSKDFEIGLEPEYGEHIRKSLENRGHRLTNQLPWTTFGGGQGILRVRKGFCGASDPRKDGCAGGF